MCRRWPSISPHGHEVPTSVWNMRYGVWLGFARETDAYLAAQRKTRS